MRDATIESIEWFKETLADKVIKSLEKNNLRGLYYVMTEKEAREKLLCLIPAVSTVGHGGSL